MSNEAVPAVRRLAALYAWYEGGEVKPRKRKPKFAGLLNEPVVPKLPEFECSDQLSQRVSALYEHYGLDQASQGAEIKLVLRLACDFVPGFEILTGPKRGKGRPKKWHEFKSPELLADVSALKRMGKTALNACRILSQLQRYAPRYGNKTPRTLYRRYQEAKRNWRNGGGLCSLLPEGARSLSEDWLVEIFAADKEVWREEAVKAVRISSSEN